MMNRREFLAATASNLLTAELAWAQATEKRYRLGIVASGSSARSAAFYVAFEERMRELGWIDGKNLTVDFEGGESAGQLTEIATRMVRRHATDKAESRRWDFLRGAEHILCFPQQPVGTRLGFVVSPVRVTAVTGPGAVRHQGSA